MSYPYLWLFVLAHFPFPYHSAWRSGVFGVFRSSSFFFNMGSWQSLHTLRYTRRVDTSDSFLLHFLGVSCFHCHHASYLVEAIHDHLHLRVFFLYIFHVHIIFSFTPSCVCFLSSRTGVVIHPHLQLYLCLSLSLFFYLPSIFLYPVFVGWSFWHNNIHGIDKNKMTSTQLSSAMCNSYPFCHLYIKTLPYNLWTC